MPEADAPNLFQRWYFRWAEPHYRRMPAPLRERARQLDRYLYSRDAVGLWIGLFFSCAGFVGGLYAAGLPLGAALVTGLFIALTLLVAVAAVWLQPEKMTAPRLVRVAASVIFGGYVGALFGFVGTRVTRPGGLNADTLGADLWEAAQRTTPILLIVMFLVALVLWAVGYGRREQLRRELAQLTLVQERDLAARQAAEARLKLLQAQIEPHFLFNTLAALGHWVDAGDPRAAPLLRSLTGFLRATTELLGRDEVNLADEIGAVRHYLEILRSRLGSRLAFAISHDAAALAQPLPPGLLLSLVENAVKHGIEPQLRGGRIEVRARCDAAGFDLVVTDDGAGLRSGWHDGVGIANSRERLAHRFGARASLVLQAAPGGAGTEARVRIAADAA